MNAGRHRSAFELAVVEDGNISSPEETTWPSTVQVTSAVASLLPRILVQLGVDDELVAGTHRLAEFPLSALIRSEVLPSLVPRRSMRIAAGLRHRLELQHTGHEGLPTKWPWKKRFVDADVLIATSASRR